MRRTAGRRRAPTSAGRRGGRRARVTTAVLLVVAWGLFSCSRPDVLRTGLVYESITAEPELRQGTFIGDCRLHVFRAGGHDWVGRVPGYDDRAVVGRLEVTSIKGDGRDGRGTFTANEPGSVPAPHFKTAGAISSDICGY